MPTFPRAALAALLALASCTRERPVTTLPKPAGIDRNPLLVQFRSCGDLEQAIEDALVLRMKSILEQNRTMGVRYPFPIGADGVPAPAAAPAAGPTDYTTTNSQVQGVDESDFVQNDGTRIAVVANGRLNLVRSWPPESLATAASLPIEGWPHDLFLTGDRAIVFSAVYVPRALEGDHVACPLVAGADFSCGYHAQNVVKITTVDVSTLSAPKVLSEVYLPGSYVSSRLIQGRVRLVTSDTLPFPDGVQLWPSVPYTTDAEWNAAIDALEVRNEALIRARTLDDWLRRGSVKRPGEPDADLGYACTDFSRSAGPVLPGLLTVATLDVATSSLVSRTTAFGEPGVVYASAQTLYVATPHWWWWPEPGQRDATYLHAFDLADPDRAVYVGSGVVDGIVRDQYGLDEHEGALRAVTTVSERVADGTEWGRIETAGRLSVLARKDGALAIVGETPAFGKGERVMGTRLVGARGFVITARQIDPLFTFDLADPATPTLVGELEMPGFIAYLHPIDDTHLLGVGQQRDLASNVNQVKVALLDVADLSAPKDLATALVGEGWSWSEALWNPKAFTWLGARNLLAIPFADWGYTWTAGAYEYHFTSDLRLFQVDAVGGTIAPAGSLSMADVYLSTSWGWSWSPWVRRSILADGYVYAISDAGIRSAEVAQLPAWLATIQFAPWAAY